jgi:uncharacterized protein (DUF305 family)
VASSLLTTRSLSAPNSLLASPRTKIIVGVVAAVALLLIGYAAGWITPRLGTPGTDSIEAGFARDMAEHHAQAVEMGMIAYQKASTPEVRSLGGDIAITQQGQIGVMNTWLKDWGLSPNSDKPPMSWMPDGQRALNGNLMPGMATPDEIAKLKSATGRQVDILFCQYMLRHHLGGLHMIEGLLSENPSGEVRDLAETMQRNQSGEIPVLESLLTNLGAGPLK